MNNLLPPLIANRSVPAHHGLLRSERILQRSRPESLRRSDGSTVHTSRSAYSFDSRQTCENRCDLFGALPEYSTRHRHHRHLAIAIRIVDHRSMTQRRWRRCRNIRHGRQDGFGRNRHGLQPPPVMSLRFATTRQPNPPSAFSGSPPHAGSRRCPILITQVSLRWSYCVKKTWQSSRRTSAAKSGSTAISARPHSSVPVRSPRTSSRGSPLQYRPAMRAVGMQDGRALRTADHGERSANEHGPIEHAGIRACHAVRRADHGAAARGRCCADEAVAVGAKAIDPKPPAPGLAPWTTSYRARKSRS